ncbi:MAG: GNAT family N-acetyltransferase [Flavobacteriia bacterium]|nr:GNAT family N-acetyltransferase [Flavobacteriia bacterium]
MMIIEKANLSTAEKQELRELWNAEYPHRLAHPSITDFEKYLHGLEDQKHRLYLTDKNQILGWYFDFIRDAERWFAIILRSSVHGMGLGSQMISQAKKENPCLNGWVIDKDDEVLANGQAYRSPLEFYQKNGFKVLKDQRLELEHISAVKIVWEKSESESK